MSLESNRRIFCMSVAGTILSLPAAGATAPAGAAPALGPGLHRLTFERPGAPTVGYALFIPPGYAPAKPAPLILGLHFGIGGGSADGAGADVTEILIGPALAELNAIIVAPDSVKGNWSTPENEKAVNALLDMVIARYAID